MGGSLVLARENTGNYLIIFIGLVIILILLTIYFLYKGVQKAHSSQEWIESRKKLPSTQKNIDNISKLANLTKQEKNLIELICRKFNVPNIEYLIRDEKSTDEYLKKEYAYLCTKPDSETMKQNLFSVKYKFDKYRSSSQVISSTKGIPAGQTFTYIDRTHIAWTFTVTESNAQGLLLSIPKTFANSSAKPAQMEKVNFTYRAKSDIAYLVDTRIIRYETAKDGSPLMFVSHSNTMSIMLRRTSRRLTVNKKCQFSAVQIESENNNDTEETSYTPKERRYDGIIRDISPSGCQVICSLPIKKEQFIYIEFPLETDTITHSAIGIIVNSEKADASEKFALHIKFTAIDLKIKNLISAYVYKFVN